MNGWKEGGEAYLPTLNAAEDAYAIPRDLLSRIAYQESHWRSDIIYGPVTSSAGCIGLMQLNPKDYPGAGKSWQADVDIAGRALANHYARFKSWQYAAAAYNWGEGNVHRYLNDGGTEQMPPETQNYLVDVFSDVPITIPTQATV